MYKKTIGRQKNHQIMRIGVVVHGPQIVDTGFAEKILGLLKNYGIVKARLGGTMGRTAVIDANLEGAIDITHKLLPSQSIDKISQDSDVVFLINYGKSSVTGHAFGYKVYNRCKSDPNLIQIERPGELDGTVIPWKSQQSDLADAVAKELKLKVMNSTQVVDAVETDCIYNPTEKETMVYRKIAGVSVDENIFLNGIVVGKSTSKDVTLVAENGILKQILGGKIKEHGVEKLGEDRIRWGSG